MRALVLGGGSVFAAYEAGCIRALTQKKGRRYDLIVGTSAGALNGAFMAEVGKTAQAQRADELVKFWSAAKESDFYRTSFFAALFRGGVYDTTPMRKLINDHVSSQTATPYACTTVNASTGELVIAKSGKVADIRPWIHASASIPVVFPPVEIEGEHYMDGGVRQNVPVELAVGAGATEIDVVPSFPNKNEPHVAKSVLAILRTASVAVYALREQLTEGDMDAWAAMTSARVRVYAPEKRPVVNPLKFDRASIQWMIQHGEEVGGRLEADA